MKKGYFLGAALIAAGLAAGPALAADNVKVGAIYPLSGNAASAGKSELDAISLAVDLVNGSFPELASLPSVGKGGLSNFGGAKIQLITADHQGKPEEGNAQTLRMITQEHVAAMIGSYHSNVSFTATAVAERQGVPFVVGDSVAANIMSRGFKWVVRVTPIASDFAKNYMEYLGDMKKAGHKVETVAVVNENTDYGTSIGGTVVEQAKKYGFNVVAQIPYNANTTDVSAQVLQLKEKNPDCVIFITYTADAILYMKTLKNLGYQPPMIIADDAGFADPAFIPAVGDISQGVMNRSAWAVGKPGSPSHRINELFKQKTGRDLDDTSARGLQAMLVLADAINRAGSTAPDKIMAALRATDLKQDQVIMGYRGVKFDQVGENSLAATYLVQLQGKEYVAVWPEKSALAPLQWPMKGWK
jgi:branched-chain amino acid transport system substrate-binding protein